jgi:hypothetical protein
MRYVVVILTLTLVLATGCARKENQGGGAATNDTIAPAAAQPDTTGTEAMTQTVNLDDGRPEAEGGVLTSGTGTSGGTSSTDTTGSMLTGTAPPVSTTATAPPATPPTTTTR